MNKDNNITCSFCNRDVGSERLILMQSSLVCKKCITKCAELFADPVYENKVTAILPKEIKALLDNAVIGQDQAKKCIAVAVYNHYKRIQNTGDITLDKTNILMAGSTGTGKTLLVRTLASILDVPVSISDATSLTGAGYVGEDVESILLRLYKAANNDLERAQRGIIYIDEIDKIAPKGGRQSASVTRDSVSTTDVQEGLLKIIEGSMVSVPLIGGRRHPQQETFTMDTSNIMFICGGAFDGIDELISQRIGQDVVGFNNTSVQSSVIEKTITRTDVINFGLIPEFVGRFSLLVQLEDLTKADLLHILTDPQNAIIKQYERLFAIDDIQIEFTQSALEAVADEAMTRKSGARELKAILDDALIDLMFEVPSYVQKQKLIIDAEFITRKLQCFSEKKAV